MKSTTLEKRKRLNPIVQYVFNNGKLLEMLEKRATALKAGDFKKVEQVQDEMTSYKAKYFDKLMRPRQAYICFQNQKNLNNAVEKFKTLKLNFNEEIKKKGESLVEDLSDRNDSIDEDKKKFELRIRRARPVSDIIW